MGGPAGSDLNISHLKAYNSVSSRYTPQGWMRQNSGSRVYPAGYTYDGQGRQQTLTTWANFSAHTGAAATTNNYDPYRGWLANKAYPDGNGTLYAYTFGARLSSRTWARGTSTAYTNNAAGDVMAVKYSDSTPGVTNGYDRRGRLTAITNGATVTTLALNDAGEVLLETNAGGVLGGLTVSNAYDGLLRRTNVAILNPHNPPSLLPRRMVTTPPRACTRSRTASIPPRIFILPIRRPRWPVSDDSGGAPECRRGGACAPKRFAPAYWRVNSTTALSNCF